MTSLSPEAIEILKSIHKKMDLKFKTKAEVWAFFDRVNGPEFFKEELGQFQLRDCFGWPNYSQPYDDDEEAYWYINVTSYGWGVTNLLKTLGLI